MTDPVQLLIDAGAIPSTPFVAQSRYSGVPLALLQLRPDEPGVVYVRRRFIPAPSTLTIAARHVVSARVGWVERSETHQWTADGYDGFRLSPLRILQRVQRRWWKRDRSND